MVNGKSVPFFDRFIFLIKCHLHGLEQIVTLMGIPFIMNCNYPW